MPDIYLGPRTAEVRLRLWLRRWLVVMVIGLTVVAVACSGNQTTGDKGTTAGDVPAGQVLLEERCTRCHTLERVTAASKSVEEWQATVARMVDKGAQLDGAEAETLMAYLAETYGP